MINEKDITDDVMKQWKEINEEKEGLNEQAYKGSILEERLRLTRQIFALEQENASLKDALEGYKQNAKWCDKCDKIADLEKENAELKENLKKWKDAIYADVENYDKQFTKAKELLNEFLDFESSCMERGIYISDKIRAEAEQFLKEVEK